MSANRPNILAEIGHLLILAEISRQQKTAAASQVVEAQDAATASSQMTEATRPADSTPAARRKQKGGRDEQ